jgi:thiol-disulfide isomerase/thioredoxin
MVSKRGPVTRFLLAAVVGWLLLATACGGSGHGFVASVDAAEATAAGGEDASSGTAPEFTLTTVDGREVQLSDSSGKIRLVDFWATWCAPCREEVPMLNELQASYGERGFQVVAISDEEAEVIQDFIDEFGVEYLNLVGTEEVAEAFGVLGLPAAFLLDGEGRVIDSFLGPKPRRVLVEKIESLLGGPPST